MAAVMVVVVMVTKVSKAEVAATAATMDVGASTTMAHVPPATTVAGPDLGANSARSLYMRYLIVGIGTMRIMCPKSAMFLLS